MWDPARYEERHAFVWNYGMDLLHLLQPRRGLSVLDLGCGTGHLTAKIAEAGAKVLGFDRSPEMVAEARQSYPDLTFLRGDATQLPFDSEFDAIFSNAALHWMQPAERVVEEMARALKPGGRLIAEFGGKGNVRTVLKALQAASLQIGRKEIASPWYFPSVGEYTSLLERHGLEVSLALLFDRPTPLTGPDGLRQWVEMFGRAFLDSIAPENREEFLDLVEEQARPNLYRQDDWSVDYRRLRVVATRIV